MKDVEEFADEEWSYGVIDPVTFEDIIPFG